MTIRLSFEYRVQGHTTAGEQLELAGNASMIFPERHMPDDYVDEGAFFAAACEEAARHFCTAKIDKTGKELAGIAVAVTNLTSRFE
jgi:hypothetical protein